MKCGSRKLIELSQIESKILKSLPFTCQFDDCGETLKYSDYIKHLEISHNIKYSPKLVQIEQSLQNQIEQDKKVREQQRINREQEYEDIGHGGLFGDDDDY